MAKRRDWEAEKEERERAAEEYVTVYPRRDVTAADGTLHKAGEPAEISKEELRRAWAPHDLVTTEKGFAAEQTAARASAQAAAELDKIRLQEGLAARDVSGATGAAGGKKTAGSETSAERSGSGSEKTGSGSEKSS